MTKRLKTTPSGDANEDPVVSSEPDSVDLQDTQPATSPPIGHSYHASACGSILCPTPSSQPSEVFAQLRHGRLDAFRRSLDLYHKDIILMKNDFGQTVLHVLTILALPYQWIRLLLMRGCDPGIQDSDGCTAAHYAAERDDFEMLKALTMPFSTQIRPLPAKQLAAIHQRCVASLALRDTSGSTVFMLACRYESVRCLDYLLSLGINDVHIQDKFGDTCLHYAVARRNEALVDKLITHCGADVNGGDPARPSALDVVQFNRQQQEPFDRTKDDAIERALLVKNAANRHHIRRIVHKRKRSVDQAEAMIDNLACLSMSSLVISQTDTAKNFARIASGFAAVGDMTNAQEFYQRALNSVPSDVLDWAEYASHLATIYQIRGDHPAALDLLQRALVLRQRFEKETEQIGFLQQAIDCITAKCT